MPLSTIQLFEQTHAAFLAGLARAEADFALEQSVRGLDSLAEVEFHPLLAAAAISANLGAHREVRYPGARGPGRRSEGRRCDLVITPDLLPLEEDATQLGLLAPTLTCPFEDALWIEVKHVAQFGPERARPDYSSALQGRIWRDLEKLAADPRIEHPAQLILLFGADAEVARHDLAISLDRAWSRGLRMATPTIGQLAIGDRLGNSVCTAALVRVIR